MASPKAETIIVIGAGASGLMAARELAQAGRRTIVLEARDRWGGRIDSLTSPDLGYWADGGAEFVHGEAPVTRALLREAGLSLATIAGRRWTVQDARMHQQDTRETDDGALHEALRKLTDDMPIAEFLRRHFAGHRFERLRASITRMVEGYDAADPERASTLALRDEWMGGEQGRQTRRVVGGYGALIDALVADCRRTGVDLHLGCQVTAIETDESGVVVRCAEGVVHRADAAIVTLPISLLHTIAMPSAERSKVLAASDIGMGNVIKLLLRFATRWWVAQRHDLADMTFLLSEAEIPVWWTQYPSEVPLLTGWLAGPRTAAMAHLDEGGLVAAGLASLGQLFERDPKDLKRGLVAARAVDWSHDPFAGGAYSYATPNTPAARDVLTASDDRPVRFAGEALYRGPDMGTVEAALASGREAALKLLEGGSR